MTGWGCGAEQSWAQDYATKDLSQDRRLMKPLHQASEDTGKDQHNSDLQQDQYIQSPTSLSSSNWCSILSYNICLWPALKGTFAQVTIVISYQLLSYKDCG